MAREPFNRIWTETPTVDDFDEPTNIMWDEGWRGGAAEDPPEAFAQNWWQNRADFALRQLERDGAMSWLSTVPYDKWAFSRGSDGEVYIAIQGNTNADPTTDDGSNWLSIPNYIRSLFNAAGGAPLFGVRAWANFDGTSFDGSGNVSIRRSGNVGSIVRLSTGIYQVSFSTPMIDENYSVSVSGAQESLVGATTLADSFTWYDPTDNGFKIGVWNNETEQAFDFELTSFSVTS